MKRIGKAVFIHIRNLLLCILAGYLLLVVVNCIPAAMFTENAAGSAKTLSKEGFNQFRGTIEQSRIDNFSDAIILANAVYHSENSFDNAIMVYRYTYGEEQPKEAYEIIYGNRAEGGADPEEIRMEWYPRYWHGYLVTLKPLLTLFNYGEIRILNAMLLCGLCGLVLLLLWKNKMLRFCGIPFLLAICSMYPQTVIRCLHYSSTTYVTLLAVILLLCQKKEHSLLWYSCFFAFVGIANVYFDLLTFPSLSLGITLGVLLVQMRRKTMREKLGLTIACGASWAFGYGGMWIGKWVLGMLAYGPSFLKTHVMGSINGYASGSMNESWSARVGIVQKLVRSSSLTDTFRWIFYAIVVALLVWLVWCCVRDKKQYYLQLLPFAIVLCIPFVWVFVLCSHNMVHGWFTYRAFVTYIFLLPTALAAVLPERKIVTPSVQDAA